MSDPVPSSAIYDATTGGLSVIVVAGGSDGDVLTRQADGTYLPETPSVGGSPGGSSGQFQWNSSGSFAGAAAVAYATTVAHVTMTAQGATIVPLVVKGAASQSGNLQEWKNSSDVMLARIASTGRLHFGTNIGYFAESANEMIVHANNGVGNFYTYTFGVTGQFICASVNCSSIIMGGSVGVLVRSGAVVTVANNTGEIRIAPDGTSRLTVDLDATAGNTRMLLWDVSAGSLKRVSIGASDSGGTGYKVLRVAN
jgi:hypothetical protein